MRLLLAPLLCLPLALLLCPPALASAAPVDDALALFVNYHQDLSKLDRARDILETELQQNPRDVDALLALSRVYFTIGDVRARTDDDKLAAYDRGRQLGKRAVELAPKNADAHFLYGANTGRWGQTKGVIRSLFLLPTVKEELATIFALDPNHAQGHALAGNVYLELPFFAGGSVAKAEEHFRKAIATEPRYTALRIGLAKVLIRKKQYAEARRELESVLNEREPGSVADWTVKDVPRARKLLDEIKGKG
jgi:tetratricopeptide (TPR) repeat protein